MSERKRCLPPIVDNHTRLLILGSLPGEASLKASRYYAHPQNQFWRLMGAVLDEPLAAMPYDQRLATLLQHGVGLWDVIAEAERTGSLDAAIRKHAQNDLAHLLTSLPTLAQIAFNGGTAARLGQKQLVQQGISLPCLALPSSSPAHTMAYDLKLAQWRQLVGYLSQPATHPS
ncbi:DNA-deoxyinosine glycosylase [Chitinimonas viridis]|uniref:DNA-deoxyinosine glycosylase n=1 Tax=Chitinimonas viridis TaxID=664880 RepID=A0ABT8AYU0_9NEIS|nr:DNA-deoxyinosine glycosylase [Chitinimonas viridis]MDN3575169.1 DNA-deoxyinosine glycosylase [Chitinimonas viridis]